MDTPIIEFKKFSFQYRSQAEPTLKQIDLTIQKGEKVLIVGPSGSGKSTLAHCINGLIPFSYPGTQQGNLKIMGKECAEMSIYEISKVVGTVLQDPDGQFVGLSVGEDIAFVLENECRPQAEMVQRVLDISTLVGMENGLGNSPYQLSGGQKQRVSLAGVLVDQVDILLFDEPLANLDPAAGAQTVALINEIHEKTDATVIIVEHRLEEALHCEPDRIVVMNNGEIVCDSAPDALLCSDILGDCGLREPLYITALKFSGAPLKMEMKVSNIRAMDLVEESISALKRFNEKAALPKKVPCPDLALEMRDVCFHYPNTESVLKNVSLQIHKGEMASVVGKNGAGKSTLSKLICGFYRPDSGHILFNGRDITSDTIRERANQIGFVMQNPNEMISKTMVYDEVALGIRLRGGQEKAVKEKVDETLRICGLYPFREWPISALSHGQKKRVTIASIMVLEPELMILDEPTAGQDFRHYTEIMEFLASLRQMGVTIMMITHDMHLMLEYSDRVIVLADGEVILDGDAVAALTDEQIVWRAHLKETSLFTLANRAALRQPQNFVRKFISYDRSIRDE